MGLDENELKTYLVTDLGYKTAQVDDMVMKLSLMDEEIIKSFEIWYKTKEFHSVPQYNKVNPVMIHRSYPFLKPPAVFILLDWFKRQPDEAMLLTTHEFGPLLLDEP